MASVSKSPAPAELPLFRFGLRHLFAFFAVASALLTELVVAQGAAGLASMVVTLVVIAHVAATALGTRLRECSPRARHEELRGRRTETPMFARAEREIYMVRSLWYGHDRSPLARLRLMVVVGFAVGGIGGVLLFAQAIGDHTSLAGLAVGAVSIAVLGGWFAFLASSFYAIFRHGWREAVENDEARMTNVE